MIYVIARFVLSIYYAVFFRLETHGSENVPKEGAAILCANHISAYDPISVVLGINRLPSFMGKKELFENKFIAYLGKCLKAFPVDRGKMDMKAIKTALKVLKDGDLLGIFAQGTRVKDGDSVAAKGGVALFAVKSGAPVIPVAIRSTYKLFSKIEVYYGEPMTFEEYKGKKVSTEELNEIAESIMKRINDMLGD